MSRLLFYGDKCTHTREAFYTHLKESSVPLVALVQTLMESNAPLEVWLRCAKYLDRDKIFLLTRGRQSIEAMFQQLHQINAAEEAFERQEQNRAEISVIDSLLLKASQGEKPWLLAELAKRQYELEVATFCEFAEPLIPLKKEWYPKLTKNLEALEEIANLKNELADLKNDYEALRC
jgi:hypothetical protein